MSIMTSIIEESLNHSWEITSQDIEFTNKASKSEATLAKGDAGQRTEQI